MHHRTKLLAAALAFTGLPSCASLDDTTGAGAIDTNTGMTVSGNLAYRERIALPPGSEATVTIEDISLADAPSRIIATRTIAIGDRQVPVPFALEVDRTQLKQRHRYSLRAIIRGPDGELLWTSDTVRPIVPAGADQDLGMVMLVRARGPADREGAAPMTSYGCGDARISVRYSGDGVIVAHDGANIPLDRVRSASGARFERGRPGDANYALFWDRGETARFQMEKRIYPECRATSLGQDGMLQPGRTWVVEDIDGRGIVDRSRVTLLFSNDRRISGQATCNTYTGSFTFADGKLKVAPGLAVTRKMCAPSLMKQEQRFLDTLRQPLDASVNGNGALILRGEQGASLLAL